MKSKESGQATVEFAFVFPLLLIVLCAIIDIGFLSYQRIALEDATRDATRYTAVHMNDDLSDDDESIALSVLKSRMSDKLSPVIESFTSDGDTVTIVASVNVKFLTGLTGIFTGGNNEVKIMSKGSMAIEP